MAWAAALPSAAEQPLSGAEFEAYAVGKTLVFREGGMSYGAEQYFEGRRVRWAFSDNQCIDGHWFEQGQQICFVYQDRPDTQCWTFYRQGSGLRAVFAGESGTELYEADQSTEPLACLGPRIGV